MEANPQYPEYIEFLLHDVPREPEYYDYEEENNQNNLNVVFVHNPNDWFVPDFNESYSDLS